MECLLKSSEQVLVLERLLEELLDTQFTQCCRPIAIAVCVQQTRAGKDWQGGIHFAHRADEADASRENICFLQGVEEAIFHAL
jgi:hypothetical protein